MPKNYYVYILSNSSHMLYIGVTGNLVRRIHEHKQKLVKGFTARYNLHRLVYFEQTNDVSAAIAREKQLKRWTRKKKLTIIRSLNPQWNDLSEDW